MPMDETLWRSETPAVCPGCPLVLDAHALVRHLIKKELQLQFKLHNNSARNVCRVELKVVCFDEAGTLLPGCESFVLTGYDWLPGQHMGELTPIPLPDARTCKVAVIPLAVRFSDGESWQNPDADSGFAEIDTEQTLLSSLGPLVETYVQELTARGVTKPHRYLPQPGSYYNLCGCGAVVPETGLCPRCGARLEELLELADLQKLSARQQRQRREGRQKKSFRRILLLVAAALLLVAGLFTRQMFQPQREQRQDYRAARAALTDGDYATAEAMFSELGDYKSSQQLLQQTYIAEARQLLEADELDQAAEVLAKIENENKAAPLYYKLGLKYLMAGRLRPAWDAFSRAPGYKDAAQQADDAAAAAAEEEAAAQAEAEEDAAAEEAERAAGEDGGSALEAAKVQAEKYWQELTDRSGQLWDGARRGWERLRQQGLGALTD